MLYKQFDFCFSVIVESHLDLMLHESWRSAKQQTLMAVGLNKLVTVCTHYWLLIGRSMKRYLFNFITKIA
jgi:hypothetical protein